MKKISLVALASLIAFSSAASAQNFDINSMPLGNIPKYLDKAPTGSVAATKVRVRNITRDGVGYKQYYMLNDDGSLEVVSEMQN